MLGRRPDGKLARDVPPYRRVMPLLMRTRNESAVYFEQELDLGRTEPFLAAYNAAHPEGRATLFHVVLWAAARVFAERPQLNRFVAGGRVWDRDGVWVSFSAKKRKDDEAPIVVVKRRLDPAASFEATVAAVHADVRQGRSDAPSTTDRELRALGCLPLFVQSALVSLYRGLDAWGLLPRGVIESDPFHASLFVANLGSLDMDAAYHHLYEPGTISVFCVIGRTREVAVVRDGQVTSRRAAVLRYTLDERVADGLYAQRALERLRALVEDPAGGG